MKISVHEHLDESYNPRTCKIGNQVWSAENLDIDDGGEGIVYNEKDGEYYYTWYAAMRIANSIPGWHLPSALEWNAAAVSSGATELFYNNPIYNDYEDAQELQKLLGIHIDSIYDNDMEYWTSTEFSSKYAHYRAFKYTVFESDSCSKTHWYLVRLIKD